MRRAETRYAKSGETRIAYQVVGQGSLDLVLVPGFPSNLEILWEDPGYCRLVKRLTAFCRLILFDKPGTGVSDAVDPRALLDPRTRADDIRTIMDATGCGRAALLGASDGAAQAMLFAAAYPERVRALVLYGGYASVHAAGSDQKLLRARVEATEATWGTGASLSHLAPSRTEDREFIEWWARLERLSAGPTCAVAQARMNVGTDVREALPRIESPTLLLHRVDDSHVEIEISRRLARAIRGARLVELPGHDHPVWMGDVDRVADHVAEFLTGVQPVADNDRVLAVLLVARIGGAARGMTPAIAERHLHERIELFREAVPSIVARHGGYAWWPGAQRIDARFNGAARAARCAVALREAAASLGLAISQGIHVGEIDASIEPLSGSALELADRIAASARPPDIVLSRLVSDLVSGSGLQFVERGALTVDRLHAPLPVVTLASERHLEPAMRAKGYPGDLGMLSPREREVLVFVADGLSNAHIAVHLGLSEHTVKRHVANILLKLELPSRAAAAGLAARRSAL